MNQNIWGSHLWFSLHTISFAYPIKPTINDQNNYKNFFVSLQNVMESMTNKNEKNMMNNTLTETECLQNYKPKFDSVGNVCSPVATFNDEFNAQGLNYPIGYNVK